MVRFYFHNRNLPIFLHFAPDPGAKNNLLPSNIFLIFAAHTGGPRCVVQKDHPWCKNMARDLSDFLYLKTG